MSSITRTWLKGGCVLHGQMFLRDLKEMCKVQLPSGICLRSYSILFDCTGKNTRAFRSFLLRKVQSGGPGHPGWTRRQRPVRDPSGMDALSYFAGWARQERIRKRLPPLNSTMAGAYLNDRL